MKLQEVTRNVIHSWRNALFALAYDVVQVKENDDDNSIKVFFRNEQATFELIVKPLENYLCEITLTKQLTMNERIVYQATLDSTLLPFRSLALRSGLINLEPTRTIY